MNTVFRAFVATAFCRSTIAVFRTFAIALLAVMFGLCQGEAQAQVMTPFRISGGGSAPQGLSLIPLTPTLHSAVGQATRLGNYLGHGTLELTAFTGPTTAQFRSGSPFVFVAANGDRLAFTYGDTTNGAAAPGEIALLPQSDGSFVAVLVAEFNPVPSLSTGRFAKVIGGSITMTWATEPFFIQGTSTTPFAYTWEGQGSLEFQTGNP